MTSKVVYEIKDLSIERVTLTTRENIVDDFTLEVNLGEMMGLVGETGAGKSISMMASVGLLSKGLEVAGGSVQFEDKAINATSQLSLRSFLSSGVALLFQNAKGALNPFKRCQNQVKRVLRIKGVPKNRRTERVRQLISSVRLDPEEIGPKYPHEISGGQAQRIAIACALATDPEILIADEPTTALDVTTQRAVLNLLKDLCKSRNMSLILITHNLALVSEYCDQVAIMHAGHIVELGPVMEIYERPLHPYTQGLISVIPDVDHPKELVSLEGSVWSEGYETKGCRFSHRCPHVSSKCYEDIPMIKIKQDHYVRCLRYQEEAA